MGVGLGLGLPLDGGVLVAQLADPSGIRLTLLSEAGVVILDPPPYTIWSTRLAEGVALSYRLTISPPLLFNQPLFSKMKYDNGGMLPERLMAVWCPSLILQPVRLIAWFPALYSSTHSGSELGENSLMYTCAKTGDLKTNTNEATRMDVEIFLPDMPVP